MIKTLDDNNKIIVKQYQPNLNAITSYHTVFSLSYYYSENEKSKKRQQGTIKTFYGRTKTEERINTEILQVLSDTDNKYPLPERKKEEIKKRIIKNSYLKARWEKTTNLNSTIITPTLSEKNHQSSTWDGEEFITLKNKIKTEDENTKRKIINEHIVSCLEPFRNQLILMKKKIKAEQKKKNDKILNFLTKKLANLEQQLINEINEFPSRKKIKKIENEINKINNILSKTKNDNEIDKKNLKFSKQLLTIVNNKKQLENKHKSHYTL